MKRVLALLFALLVLGECLRGQNQPNLSDLDRIRLAEGFHLGEALGNRIWQDWDKAPFAVLLVTQENEFLVRHPKPSEDFRFVRYDPLLKSSVYFRKRTFAPNLLATFPAVGEIPTIVIGQAENTAAKTSTPWVITLLHEHFHQLQYSQPDYAPATIALGLSSGDKTGMWMLNYAFPYDSPEVKQQFSLLSNQMMDLLKAGGKPDVSAKIAAYLAARHQLQRVLSPDDYKYLSFQLWQEGIARYTEYRVAQLAASRYKPSKEFRELKDYTSFERAAQAAFESILKELSPLELGQSKRAAFYPFGAGEGLLLDKINPKWQKRYFVNKFSLDEYFNQSR